MDKRLFTALALCSAIVIGWTLLFPQKRAPQPQPAPTTATTTQDGAPAAASSTNAAAPAPAPEKAALTPVVADTTERTEVLSVGAFRAVFSNRGGVLEELRTSAFQDHAALSDAEKADWNHWVQLVSKVDDPTSRRAFTLRTMPSSVDLSRAPLEGELWTSKPIGDAAAPNGIEFSLSPGQGVTFTKRFVLDPVAHRVRFEFAVRNDGLANNAGLRSFQLTPAAGVPNTSGDSFYPEPRAIAFSRARDGSDAKPKVQHVSASGGTGDALPVGSPLGFVGVYNKYFAVLMRGADETSGASLASASWRPVHDPVWAAAHPDKKSSAWQQLETDVELQVTLPPVGETRTFAYDVYAGPKQKAVLEAAHPDYALVPLDDLGFLSGISRVLLWILSGFHALTSSWGLAIILLTISVRAVLFPINRRSQTAMARFQAKVKRMQPKIEELKKRFADDPARLRQEQAKLMQSEDALMPPLGGCLPPLLQIPVFMGLYRALGVSFDLRQTPFLGWIHDLSLPDRLIPADFHLPIFGTHVTAINLLPPLMVIAWILQQRAMPKPTEEQALMMYKMMMFMPIVMGIFLYNYAAGLSLYMITQSLLGILEQKVIRKYWPVDDKEPPKTKKKPGFLQRVMEAQEQKVRELEARKKAGARR